MLTDQEKRLCLDYGPFDWDMGEPGDRTLGDKIVTARAEHICVECRETILPGTHNRIIVCLHDGAIDRFRLCEDCFRAMAASWTDGGAALERRSKVRNRNMAQPLLTGYTPEAKSQPSKME